MVPHLVEPAVAIRAERIYSIANDNSKFQVVLTTSALPDGAFPTLSFDNHRLAARSAGGDEVDFDVDRATALALARAWSITARERQPLDAGMRYSWRFPEHVAPGAPATITLIAENVGPTAVGFQLGGRQRGPRDNRFTFAVKRDGAVVPIKDAPDFGGPTGFKRLAPGERVEVSCDLRSWIGDQLDRPGRYVVIATHETDLSTDGQLTDVWDIAPTGQGAIVVR